MDTSGTPTNYYPTDQPSTSTINNPSTENCWSQGPLPSSSRVHRKPFAPMSLNGNDTYPRYPHKGHESTLEGSSDSNHGGSIERQLLDGAWNDDYTDHHDHTDYYHNTMERGPAHSGQFAPIPMIQEQFYGNEEGGYAEESNMVAHNQYEDTMRTAPNVQFDCDPTFQQQYVGNDEEGYFEERLPVYQEFNNGEGNNVNQYEDSMAHHHYIGNDGGYFDENLPVYQEQDDGEQQMVFENTPYQDDEAVNSVMPSADHSTTVPSTTVPAQYYSKQQLDNILNAEISEDIDTVHLCKCISMELKDSSIPQHVFAKRILGRSQGTLSDLLKHPKPFNSLKTCGKLTFIRMHNWMIQPLEMRIAILNVKGDEGSEESSESSRPNPTKNVQRKRKASSEESAPKRSRMTFTEIQKSTLKKLFEEEQRPSSDMQQTIANHLGLELCQVQNFYMNSRRRVGRKSIKTERQNSAQEGNMDVEGYEEYQQ